MPPDMPLVGARPRSPRAAAVAGILFSGSAACELGYALAGLLLLNGRYLEGVLVVFPLWVLWISPHILIDKRRHPARVIVLTWEKAGE